MKKKKPKTKHISAKTSGNKKLWSFHEGIVRNSQKILNNRITIWFLMAVFCLAVYMYYQNIGWDTDIWWHIKYGEHYMNNFSWKIDHSDFSWTPVESEWKYVTWIGSSLLYLIFKHGSFPGLTLFQFIILLSIGLYYIFYIKHLKTTFTIVHITAFFIVLIAINLKAGDIKPEMLTIFLFTSIVFIYFYSKISIKNYFFCYPIIFLIWVNSHGGFIMGIAFISLIFLLETSNYFFIQKNDMSKKLFNKFAIFVILSYAVLIVNPYGIYYPLEILKKFFISDRSHFKSLAEYVSMWKYLFSFSQFFKITITAWTLVLIELLFLLLSAYVYWKTKFFDITVILINIIFFILGMSLLRTSIFFPIIWLFSWEYIVKKSTIRLNYSIAPLSLLLFILAVSICIFYSLRINPYNIWFESKTPSFIPDKEVEIILKNEFPGPLFNDYSTGGYIIWAIYPKYKVFIDPRFSLYVKTGVWDDYLDFLKNPNKTTLEKIVLKYPFRTAIVNHINNSKIAEVFLESPDWQLVYFEKIAAVFIHKQYLHHLAERKFQADISSNRFKHIKNPFMLNSLFQLYYTINPVDAKEIMKIYENNVSNYYIRKKRNLQAMSNILSVKQGYK